MAAGRVLCEEVRETGTDLLVSTLPFVSPTLQGMLPTAAQFSYFPAGSSLPCSIAVDQCHATLQLFKKAFQTVQKCEYEI